MTISTVLCTQVFQDFSGIKQLDVTGHTVAKLSTWFGRLSALEDLTLRDGHPGLKRLPDNFGALANVKRLTILCMKLEELPESFGNLSALTDLTLVCRSLERLPKNFKHLCSLERLVIDGCVRLRELANVSDLTGLRMLTIDRQVFQDFSGIKQLDVIGHTVAKLLPWFGRLSALEDLTLWDGHPGLKRLPDNSRLCALEDFRLWDGHYLGLRRLPDNFESPLKMRNLS